MLYLEEDTDSTYKHCGGKIIKKVIGDSSNKYFCKHCDNISFSENELL